jgi:hypothetical protein
MSLQVGFVECNITPPLSCAMAGYADRDHGATALEDPLKAQVLFLRNEQTAIALVCTDLIGVDEETVAEIRQRASKLTELKPQQIMICASHTHFGPALRVSGHREDEQMIALADKYREGLIYSLATAISEAASNAQLARVGYSTTRAWGISFNRRLVDLAGDKSAHVKYTLPAEEAVAASYDGARLADAWPRHGHLGPRLTPPMEILEGLSAGIVDNEVPLLRVDTADGRPLATLISFACHAVVGSGDHYAISADYPGQARWAFEQTVGGPLLFAAGCAGDQVPTWRRGNSRQRVGRALGCQAAKSWQEVDELADEITLACTSRKVTLPLPIDYPNPEDVRQKMAALDNKSSDEYRRLQWQLQRVEKVAKTGGASYEMWAARVGDMGIACTPGETLAEIGLQIKQRSPFKYTSIINIANATAAYLCTDHAIREGGYEPGGMNPGGLGTENVLVETAVEMLSELHDTG